MKQIAEHMWARRPSVLSGLLAVIDKEIKR